MNINTDTEGTRALVAHITDALSNASFPTLEIEADYNTPCSPQIVLRDTERSICWTIQITEVNAT